MVCHMPASAKNIHSGLRLDRFLTRFWAASIINDGSRSSSGLGMMTGTRAGRPPAGAGSIFVAAAVGTDALGMGDTAGRAGTVEAAGAFEVAGRFETGSGFTNWELTTAGESVENGILGTGCTLATCEIFETGGIGDIGETVDTGGKFESKAVPKDIDMAGAVARALKEAVSVGAWDARGVVTVKPCGMSEG